MLENLTLLSTASAMARHATTRHSVIAENVAHADTPGYVARDVESFFSRTDGFPGPRANRVGHVGASTGSGRPEIVDLDLPRTLNGNSVTLEDQMVRSAEAQAQYSLATTIFSKSVDFLRLGLGRNR